METPYTIDIKGKDFNLSCKLNSIGDANVINYVIEHKIKPDLENLNIISQEDKQKKIEFTMTKIDPLKNRNTKPKGRKEGSYITKKDIVMRYIHDNGPISLNELAKGLPDIPIGSISTYIKTLKNENMVDSPERAVYKSKINTGKSNFGKKKPETVTFENLVIEFLKGFSDEIVQIDKIQKHLSNNNIRYGLQGLQTKLRVLCKEVNEIEYYSGAYNQKFYSWNKVSDIPRHVRHVYKEKKVDE